MIELLIVIAIILILIAIALPNFLEAQIRSRVNGRLTGHLAYGAVFGMGPDKIAGDWLRESDYTVDADGDGLREGLPYIQPMEPAATAISGGWSPWILSLRTNITATVLLTER